MMDSTIALFCCLDDFAKLVEDWERHHLIPSHRQRRRAGKLSLGEMLSIMERTGIYFVDSTKLAVCQNARISRNRVFQGMAKRGRTAMGWFFGFKLHLLINHKG